MTSTPGDIPPVQGWVALALGLACVVVSVLVWRGTWRSWVGGPTGSAPLFVFPAGALLAFDYAATFVLPEGRTGSRIAAPLLLAAILVIVLGLWGPSWFGPRWYRARHARGTATPAADRQPAPAQNSEALARSARRPAKPERRRQAALLEPGLGAPEGTGEPDLAPGHLLLYPDEIVFCAEAADDAVAARAHDPRDPRGLGRDGRGHPDRADAGGPGPLPHRRDPHRRRDDPPLRVRPRPGRRRRPRRPLRRPPDPGLSAPAAHRARTPACWHHRRSEHRAGDDGRDDGGTRPTRCRPARRRSGPSRCRR